MTSAVKQRANRVNAARSTGPRTRRGKMRSARNALKHGLALPVTAVSELSSFSERIARILAGPDADAGRLELARRIAEAQLDLRRVRALKLAITARLDDTIGSNERGKSNPADLGVADLLDQLGRFDRYERRAQSRRKFAARAFDAAASAE